MIERVNAFVVGDGYRTSLSCSMSMLRLLSRECSMSYAKLIGWTPSVPIVSATMRQPSPR